MWLALQNGFVEFMLKGNPVTSLAMMVFGGYWGVRLYQSLRGDGHGTNGYGKILGRLEASLGTLRTEVGQVQTSVGEVREAQARAEERNENHDREIERLRNDASTVDRRISEAMSKVAARCQEIIDPINSELRSRVLDIERRMFDR